MNRIIYGLVMLMSASILSAQDFDALLYQVVSNNPEIASLKAANESALQEMRSENNLPETEVEVEHQWGQKNVGNKWSVGVSQGFEWPGVYGARREANERASEAMSFLNRSNYLDKLLEVKLLFIDIINTRKNQEVMEQVCAHMAQLKSKYHEGYKLGEVNILDVNKIDIEYIAVMRKCNALKTQLNELNNALMALNGGKDCSEILQSLKDYPAELLKTEDEYASLIKQYDPQLRYNEQLSLSQVAKARVAKYGNFPGFSLGYMHVNELGEHFNGLKVGISLPIFSNRHKVKAANALLESVEYENRMIEIEKLSAMYGERAKAKVLHEEIADYQGVFENSDNIELLKKALDGGEISLLTYLQEVNYFLEAQREYMDIVYQYHYTLARLNRYSLLEN